MLKGDLSEAISHIPDNEDVVIVVQNESLPPIPIEDGDVLRILDVGFQAGLHVIRAELP